MVPTGTTPWTEPTGVLVTPLVQELIVPLGTAHSPARRQAEQLLVDLLESVPSTPLTLPVPTDPRLRTITDALVADSSDGRDLAAWVDHVAAGVRTLTRRFRAETGMTSAQWRTHARIRARIRAAPR